ncbi:hypothetical protein DH2020_033646 [Rehmannia glutinosa]|uniref:DUF4220 domain-containing protein n=1 Tax=Rehmannia glutinosa TaxID=99300 RepID=A0ABR0VE65_REHGL
MEEQASMEEARSPVDTVITKEPERIAENVTVLRDERSSHEVIQVVQEGYRSYCNTLRGLIVDYMFSSFHERNESRRFFFGLKPNEAFGVMEVELNFMYDELFTKMATVHRNYYGYLFRFTCSILIMVAFMLFKSHEKLYFVDLPITYALLVGAMILEFVALIKILFSDWTIVRLKHSTFLNVIHSIHTRVSDQARWSESISQHNLISYCLKKRFKWLVSITDHFGLKSTLDELRHKSHMHADEGIKNFIFYELKGTAQGMSDAVAREICYSRGKGAITDHENLDSVKSSVMDVEYDKSVLLWHIATDLLYFTIDAPNQDDEPKPDHRQICKILSDYMLYLLVMRPTMMSEVAGISQIRFQDTCAEAMRFFHGGKSMSEQKEACEKLLSVNTRVKPVEVKGDKTKSLLFDACILAKDLRTVDCDEMWEMMSKVWLELLCFGASHCKGNAHAQQLSKGGELITFVWLLMAHFGLGDQFSMGGGHARTN